MQPVTHALFDLDGLLLDTESIYTKVTQRIVARYGKTYDWNLKRNMIGRPALDSAAYLINAMRLPITPADYLRERNTMLREEFAECDALPGAEKLIRHLHRWQIPMAVASSSDRDLLDIKKAKHPWFELFNLLVSGDEIPAGRGKPAPDIFLKAAAGINAPPENTLVFEDSPAGLQAGIAAGLRVIAVPDPHMEKSQYRGAELILQSLTEFNPAQFGLHGY